MSDLLSKFLTPADANEVNAGGHGNRFDYGTVLGYRLPMPYLFCETHGQEQRAATIANQVEYREIGENVLIVSGRLRRGGWLCDRCNAALSKGSTAYLHAAFPKLFAEELSSYDYRYEQQYFDMKTAKVAVYGAKPPNGMPAVAMYEAEI